ncbi:MAG: hypothetical protein KC503_40255 [Myxococcales bacterium]|nr:hypothetical protein [Myxococcales bacterium]
MDEKAALAAFERALQHAHTKPEQAVVHVYRGIALFNLLKAAEGRAAFRRALKLDLAVSLPKLTSPKIRKEFDIIKRSIVSTAPTAAKASKPPEVSKTPHVPVVAKVKPAVAAPPTTSPPSSADASSPSAPGAEPSAPINWGGWISAGAAVAAAGLAITFGVLSRAAADRAADLDLGSAEAQSEHDRAKSFALGTNILIGVAAAGAVSATLFFILGRRAPRTADSARATPSLAAAPLWLPGGGAGIAIRGSLPGLR